MSLVVVAHTTRSSERTYFWSLLVGAALTSIAGNALHALIPADQPLPGLVAAVIATIPPVFLLLSTHSLTLLIRRRPDRIVTPVSNYGLAEAHDPSAGHTMPAGLDDGAAVRAPGERLAVLDPVSAPGDARPFLDPARALRERHNFDTPTSRIAAILHHFHTNPEASNRELGAAGNVHHNTAAKIVNAYRDTELVSNTRS
ncbi:hypothetical protein [Williamsia herbipolensis]|uniref:hypothetical protein n=1 Tax=Williamsia herbipolensis TaxID=1603258 RepID=UPI0006968226|nr:hypothetical protein [Williamsia herbipolensis]